MREAVDLIRKELGPNASVLHTREIKSGIVGRMMGSRRLEVVASKDADVPSRFADDDRRLGDDLLFEGQTLDLDNLTYDEVEEESLEAADHEGYDDQSSSFNEILSFSARHVHDSGFSIGEDPTAEAWEKELFDCLYHADFSVDSIDPLIDKVRHAIGDTVAADEELAMGHLIESLQTGVRAGGPIRTGTGKPRTVALVGPTGVGKTTTLAKLAAYHRIKKQLNVGLITIDTYRIAAVDQLQTYADIIDVPLCVVSTPKEMRSAVMAMRDADLVLIDTVGRSPRDSIRIQELRSLLAVARPDEVHLVLSVVANARGFDSAVNAFGQIGISSLLLTKLDETGGLGGIWPSIVNTALPLSYLTDGQDVPNDIEVIESDRLARLALGFEVERKPNNM